MSEKPICVDFYCGLGGWAEGFLSEDFDVIGFDIERHDYGTGGYPGQLILQDVLTICGIQFKPILHRLAVIVASPPCQKYSYMAMPWKRAKQMAKDYRGNLELYDSLNILFNACFRIQREASEAAGRHIPMVVENVKGAEPWVGRARWHFGSYYLWGDVPALMPFVKITGQDWSRYAKSGEVSAHWRMEAIKNDGGSWFNIAHNTTSGVGHNPDGRKGFTPNGEPLGKNQLGRRHWSNSIGRKAASAQIAKIPFPLAQHIARSFYPKALV